MTSLTSLLFAGLAGTIFGTVFFYSLWLSTLKITNSTNPNLWLFGSWLTRMALLIIGFYYVADGDWLALLACFVGFQLSRKVLINIILHHPKCAYKETEL